MLVLLFLWLIASARADILSMAECPPGADSKLSHAPYCRLSHPCAAPPDRCPSGSTCETRSYCLVERLMSPHSGRKKFQRAAPDGTLLPYEEPKPVMTEEILGLCDSACKWRGTCEEREICVETAQPSKGKKTVPPPEQPDSNDTDEADPAPDVQRPPSFGPSSPSGGAAPESDGISPIAVGALVSGAVLLALAGLGGSRRP